MRKRGRRKEGEVRGAEKRARGGRRETGRCWHNVNVYAPWNSTPSTPSSVYLYRKKIIIKKSDICQTLIAIKKKSILANSWLMQRDDERGEARVRP